MGASEAARLHWWKARTSSGLNAPTTVWKTPRLWKMTKSFSCLFGRNVMRNIGWMMKKVKPTNYEDRRAKGGVLFESNLGS